MGYVSEWIFWGGRRVKDGEEREDVQHEISIYEIIE